MNLAKGKKSDAKINSRTDTGSQICLYEWKNNVWFQGIPAMLKTAFERLLSGLRRWKSTEAHLKRAVASNCCPEILPPPQLRNEVSVRCHPQQTHPTSICVRKVLSNKRCMCVCVPEWTIVIATHLAISLSWSLPSLLRSKSCSCNNKNNNYKQ